ncbi:hypothetical protein EDB87DRAFT_1597434 [Lactarius vividus]|nr:hypothetical protein EDB87DRAFT_1597434 [Lactarius vividus]
MSFLLSVTLLHPVSPRTYVNTTATKLPFLICHLPLSPLIYSIRTHAKGGISPFGNLRERSNVRTALRKEKRRLGSSPLLDLYICRGHARVS